MVHGLTLKLLVEPNFNPDLTDTTTKHVFYWIPNNVDTVSGKLKVSRNLVYQNSWHDKYQPYIDAVNGNIYGGFNDCASLQLSGGSKFSADTMIINFKVNPSVGASYYVLCKYLKL